MTRSSLLLFILALLAPLLSSLKEAVTALPKTALSTPSQVTAIPKPVVSLTPQPAFVTMPASNTANQKSAPPTLTQLSLPITSVNGTLSAGSKTVRATFPIFLKSPTSELGSNIVIEGDWHSQVKRTKCHLLWSRDKQAESRSLEIQPNDFLIATATIECAADAVGPGQISFKYCFDKLPNGPCTRTESAFALGILNSSPPKLEKLELPAVSVKAPLGEVGKQVQADFRLLVKSSPSESGDNLFLEGAWHSQTKQIVCPLFWPGAAKNSPSKLEVKPNDTFYARALLKCDEDAIGPGFIRFKYCFDTPVNQLCTFSETAFELVLDTTLPPRNEFLFFGPLAYAVFCLAIGSLVLLRQVSKPDSGYSFKALGNAPFSWKIDQSSLANINAATAIISALATLGLSPDSLSAAGQIREYSAWSAGYVFCAGLGITIFDLLKKVVPGIGGASPTEVGSLWGFYCANGFNLFGVGGQLLFAHYALEVLSKTLKLGPIISICVPYLPSLLALATVFYIITRFQLVAFAPTNRLLESTSAVPQNSML